MQTRIGRVWANNKKCAESRRTCHICGLVFATCDNSMVLYTHANGGGALAFCYGHLFEIINRRLHDSYLPVLSHTMPKGFNLKDYLNLANKKITDKPLLDKKVQMTLQLITEILDATKLSKYVGGIAEINTGGLREANPLIPVFA